MLPGLTTTKAPANRLGRWEFRAVRDLVRLEITRFVTGEDPQVLQWNVVEYLLGHPGILRQHVGRRVREPVRQEQRVALGRALAAIIARSRQRGCP
jgi:hypothetical protein